MRCNSTTQRSLNLIMCPILTNLMISQVHGTMLSSLRMMKWTMIQKWWLLPTPR